VSLNYRKFISTTERDISELPSMIEAAIVCLTGRRVISDR